MHKTVGGMSERRHSFPLKFKQKMGPHEVKYSDQVIYWVEGSVHFCLEGRGGAKRGNANFKTKHTEPFPQEIPSALCYRVTELTDLYFVGIEVESSGSLYN